MSTTFSTASAAIGATVAAPKLFIAVRKVVILGHKCSYDSRFPEDPKVAKIRDWPPCGFMRVWIKNYAKPVQKPNKSCRDCKSSERCERVYVYVTVSTLLFCDQAILACRDSGTESSGSRGVC
jgi:hypothetical protein